MNGFHDRDIEMAIKRQTHKPLHMLKHRWEQSDRGQSTGRRERVGRQGREGETDMEPKPPNEPTPRKDRHFSV